MPESEVILSSSVTQADRLRELQEIMRSGGDDIASLITEEQTTAPMEQVVTTTNPEDIERASLSLIQSAVDGGGGPPDLGAAVGKAGMTPEMYLQMTESPTFWSDFKDLNKRFFWVACLPQYLKALRERALAGDPKAYTTMAEFFGEDSASLDERSKSLVNASDEAILSEIRSTKVQLENMERELLRSLSKPKGAEVAEEDAIRDALQVRKAGRR